MIIDEVEAERRYSTVLTETIKVNEVKLCSSQTDNILMSLVGIDNSTRAKMSPSDVPVLMLILRTVRMSY